MTVKAGRTEEEAAEGEEDLAKYDVFAMAALAWWSVDMYNATPGTFLWKHGETLFNRDTMDEIIPNKGR